MNYYDLGHTIAWVALRRLAEKKVLTQNVKNYLGAVHRCQRVNGATLPNGTVVFFSRHEDKRIFFLARVNSANLGGQCYKTFFGRYSGSWGYSKRQANRVASQRSVRTSPSLYPKNIYTLNA
jgi:hypothetical protein